ncbi:hypothetical protein GPZ74_30340 [Burkholderia pseudomallei]|uniref:hypothetical protein n=1 Tax=Burkholderia pseudomallei TaxID=28450 RepID=UPI0013237700|nr:hypothetical protein [Burkholderia pseudomallei]MVZ88207.1 hypothetical protein [Burkholderia pseudomallei]
MKIVIQCAGRKIQSNPDAGFRSSDNQRIKFVAHPELAPHSDSYVYVKPDDLFDGAQTWRQHLLNYNRTHQNNPCHLLPAYRLYSNPIYRKLVERFGIEKIFILSAGWGLIRSDFLIPDYDITFSVGKNVERYARRIKSDSFSDFRLLPDDGEKITFLGGKDYLPLFTKLTADLIGPKVVFYNTKSDLQLGTGFIVKRFETNRQTNWQYECAQMLVDAAINL